MDNLPLHGIDNDFPDDVDRPPFAGHNKVNAIPILAAMFPARTRDPLSSLWQFRALSTIHNSALSLNGYNRASRFRHAGHFVPTHFRTCLGIHVIDSTETEGNCEFCALKAPRGSPRYQVLFLCWFLLWGASRNFCELSDVPRLARLITLSI